MAQITLVQAVQQLQAGQVIAYPTEAVYGLGCDPFNQTAMQTLLHVKQRPLEKGVILIAASIEQILPLVKLQGEPWQAAVERTWPGPVTWVLPVQKILPIWITGGRDTVAVRVTAHQDVQQLCSAFGGPLISTSANLTGSEPARSCQEVAAIFAEQLDCLQGELGQLSQPTQIFDASSGRQLR
ncbi:threonylcarbamoyl-AMP synthase [Thiosulfatimonas sediminis]|uniref:Threonylcarbamoyl-AMP synthase n=1 Tax=Thiosulfatimonas sediminis TaxID=2675054 RepID=A0A6F8PRB3_9GAMM|nr:Sua5/YciO/YrdC/YwlC family protein [Thiosulfatimonas sediminis]BBP44672.1 threonylcarbamoyl-AMP synthase [Thiosulfatimonas sediminis]